MRSTVPRAGLPAHGGAGAVPAAEHEGVPLPHRHVAELLAGQQAGARAAAARAGAARPVRAAAAPPPGAQVPATSSLSRNFMSIYRSVKVVPSDRLSTSSKFIFFFHE